MLGLEIHNYKNIINFNVFHAMKKHVVWSLYDSLLQTTKNFQEITYCLLKKIGLEGGTSVWYGITSHVIVYSGYYIVGLCMC